MVLITHKRPRLSLTFPGYLLIFKKFSGTRDKDNRRGEKSATQERGWKEVSKERRFWELGYD